MCPRGNTGALFLSDLFASLGQSLTEDTLNFFYFLKSGNVLSFLFLWCGLLFFWVFFPWGYNFINWLIFSDLLH